LVLPTSFGDAGSHQAIGDSSFNPPREEGAEGVSRVGRATFDKYSVKSGQTIAILGWAGEINFLLSAPWNGDRHILLRRLRKMSQSH
jgi:hypothetical protein